MWNGENSPKTLDSLPRWEERKLVVCDEKSNKPLPWSETWSQVYWAVVDKDGNVQHMLSNPHKLPSSIYRNLTPRDFVTAAMNKAKDMYEGIGDISIMSIVSSVAWGGLLVIIKCPETFSLASNAKDEFGTTLVLRNSYKQESGMLVSSGAIRSVCTNGCIFGRVDMSLGWNHRNVETLVSDKVKEVLTGSSEKAREYMAELETVVMPTIEFVSDGSDSVWQVRRTFQEMADRTTMAIAKLPLSWHQKKLVLKEAYRMQFEKKQRLSKYDLWNACTAVASHHLQDPPGRANVRTTVPIRRDIMLREINKAFVDKGLLDLILAWDEETFEKEKQAWIELGWKKKYWNPVGPSLQVLGKRDAKISDESMTPDDEMASDESMTPDDSKTSDDAYSESNGEEVESVHDD